MYGHQAVVGIMLPSSCTVYEQEFLKITSGIDGLIGCPTRMRLLSCDAQGLIDMNDYIVKATEELSTLDPDLIVYMCTSGSFVGGFNGEEQIRKQISDISNAPTMTTSQAVVDALDELDLTAISMWTPYDLDVTEREIDYLAANGIEVLDFGYGDIPDNLDRGRQTPEETYARVMELDASNADGVLISCGNIRSIEVLDKLEDDLGIPVISASQATTWLALRKVGITSCIEGFGSLLLI